MLIFLRPPPSGTDACERPLQVHLRETYWREVTCETSSLPWGHVRVQKTPTVHRELPSSLQTSPRTTRELQPVIHLKIRCIYHY